MDVIQQIERSADRWTDELIAIRRRIHEHPELGFEEHETSKIIQSFLARLEIPFRAGLGKTGVVALLAGGKPGPTIALRADMDALPLTEQTGLAYASRVPGKMHACGHDAHTAIGLGVAAVMSDMRADLAGRVMFIFQPAEEILTGAVAMLNDGALDDIKPDAILGFHNWPPVKTGTVGWHADAVMSSSDSFDLTIRGVAGHGAHPHLAVDAIVGAANFITQLQTIVSREIAPYHPAVVTIGRINGGTVRNIIAPSVELSATVRSQDPEVTDQIQAAVRRILDGMKIGLRLDYDLTWTRLVPVLRNDKATLERVLAAVREMLGPGNVVQMAHASMGSEDYAWFAERIPSAHLRIGSSIDGLDTSTHRSDYQLNEKAIPNGVKVLSRAVLALMA